MTVVQAPQTEPGGRIEAEQIGHAQRQRSAVRHGHHRLPRHCCTAQRTPDPIGGGRPGFDIHAPGIVPTAPCPVLLRPARLDLFAGQALPRPEGTLDQGRILLDLQPRQPSQLPRRGDGALERRADDPNGTQGSDPLRSSSGLRTTPLIESDVDPPLNTLPGCGRSVRAATGSAH